MYVPNKSVLDGSEIKICGVRPFQSASAPSARTVCARQCHAERNRDCDVVCSRVLITSNGTPTPAHARAGAELASQRRAEIDSGGDGAGGGDGAAIARLQYSERDCGVIAAMTLCEEQL